MAQPQRRPDQGVVRFYNFLPEGAAFLDQVLAGLAQPQKALPSQWFHDARGRVLFEHICASPDYPAARTELALLREHGDAMAKFLGPDCQLIEFGSGVSPQTRLLIELLQPPLYVPVGIDADGLHAAADALARMFPWLNINAVCADLARPLALPEFVGVPIRRKAAYFSFASTGLFTWRPAAGLLPLARRSVGSGGALLVGVDLNRDQAAADAAHDDAAGIAAAFNLNLLVRINRELGGDFQLRRFHHRVSRNAARIESHLESVASQFVHVGGKRFSFRQGETVLTGISSGHGVDEFRAQAQRAGFAPGPAWTDAANRFSLQGMTAV